MKFVCKNCGYRFKSENNQRGKNCPYCGEKKLIEEPDAEKIIEETG